MGDNKENDFWKSSSDDDFWKKPVADDGWLKDDTGKAGDDFWNTDSSADYSGLSKEFFENEKPRQDPYYEKEIKRQENTGYQNSSEEFRTVNPYIESHVHHDSGWVMEQHEQENRSIAGNDKSGNQKKRIHVRTLICLIAILLAVLSIVTAVIVAKMVKKRAFNAVCDLDYRQEVVSDTFRMYQNNYVTLEDQAYTIVTKESFRGFPEGLKLIAVYVEVESKQYVRDSYAMRDIYIGFEENGANSYKKPARKDLITPYVYGYGFQDDQVLGTYGIGNGSDRSGFYFFFVPEDTDRITFYAEQKKTVEKIQVIDTLYIKEMKVLPEDEELTGELVEREGY